jgi:hypothetical protein
MGVPFGQQPGPMLQKQASATRSSARSGWVASYPLSTTATRARPRQADGLQAIEVDDGDGLAQLQLGREVEVDAQHLRVRHQAQHPAGGDRAGEGVDQRIEVPYLDVARRERREDVLAGGTHRGFGGREVTRTHARRREGDDDVDALCGREPVDHGMSDLAGLEQGRPLCGAGPRSRRRPRGEEQRRDQETQPTR